MLQTFIEIHDRFEKSFCFFAKEDAKFNDTISNYKNIGTVEYTGRSCHVKMNMYQTTGTGTVFYSFSTEMAPYLNELQTPEMRSMMKTLREIASGK